MAAKILKTTEQAAAERRAEITENMHVAQLGNKYLILEIPAPDGSPCDVWDLLFSTKRAAELFVSDLLGAYAESDPGIALSSLGHVDRYEKQARVLEFLEQHAPIADLHELARDLVHSQPWHHRPNDQMDEQVPF